MHYIKKKPDPSRENVPLKLEQLGLHYCALPERDGAHVEVDSRKLVAAAGL